MAGQPTLGAVDSLEDLMEEDLQSVERLDYVHDLLKLLGAVLGLHTLLEVSVSGSKESARVSAAKELAKLDEDPERIAERLRAAPFADMDMDELRAIVETGELDPEKAMEAVRGER